MILLNEQEIQNIYGMKQAISDMEKMLEHKHAGKIESPMRTVIEFPEEDGSVLYMPSTDLDEEIMAMKAVTIFPNNPSQGKPTTQGVVLLSNAKNGEHVAMLNASYLTRLRTGAISGIATDRLARKNSETLTMIGTGGMAFEQALGVLAVRDIKEILLINPTKEKAHHFKEKLYDFGVDSSIKIDVLDDVSEAVSRADVICCSTRSHDPVFNGKDVKPGTHVNGVGSYLPHMREVDFTFIERAAKIVVDDMEGVTEEAGELIHANEQADWSYDKIHGELIELVTDQISVRENDDEITFFKSVGAAYYDLAVANGVYKIARDTDAGTKVEI
ncbi:ornithine cyclodeaminase family protein [Pseudogracilibacillus sp. SO30301A]|uniref:ornithine cyclodeaminase family protein n=1 Tax=Pseudogracilibacillus sp. SO30301A TaxID=3098291 RepID=UPI00300E15F7